MDISTEQVVMAENSAITSRGGGPVHLVLWMILGGTFLASYYPVLRSLVHTWAHSDDYSHCFAIIPLAVYILWQKRQALHIEPVRGSWVGLLVATAVLIVYVAAKKGEMQTIASVSMIFFLWSGVIFLFGSAIFRACLFPLLILFFMIPVPAQIMASLTIPLQLIVTKASVGLASLIGIPIVREGNVIELPKGTFQVVQACSGLRSIMTMLTLGAVLAYLTLRSNLLRGILFFLAIPIAIAVNIFRVFVLVTVFYYLAVDLSGGTLHTILGLIVFGIAIGLFLLARKGLALCER
jgi:exosortase